MRISDWSSDVCSSDLRAKHDRAERAAVARRRSDGDQAGDDAGAEAQGRTLVAAQTLGDHPEQARRCGCDKGVDHRTRGRAICLQRQTGVEAEPAHPKLEEHTTELHSLTRLSDADFCLEKKKRILLI